MNDERPIKPAVFIDRDGTLIEEVNFLSRVEDVRIFSYTREAIELLKNSGFLIMVVTNQSGIGRGIYTEAAMNAIHKKLQVVLSGAIDAFYFCPHLPRDGCACRKPSLGMIEAGCADFAVDMQNSWMIGDKKLDIETGFNAGIRTALVKTGYGQQHLNQLERTPDIVAEDLLDATKLLLAR